MKKRGQYAVKKLGTLYEHICFVMIFHVPH